MIAFVVLSCDNYSDLWSLFISQFEKNWSDCPFDKYFITNNKKIPNSTFKEIRIGEDTTWSNGLKKVLTLLKEKYSYIFITLEDLPIIEPVDTKKINTLVKLFLKDNGNYLKFIKKPSPTHRHNNFYGLLEAGSMYRSTCVYSLWKIDTLINILNINENAWEFEKNGSIRSDKFDNFFVVYQNAFTIVNAVIKRKWVPNAIRKLKSHGLNFNIKRPVLKRTECLKLFLKTIFFKLFCITIPWQYRRSIINLLKGRFIHDKL